MKSIQAALAPTGIPSFAHVWRASAAYPTPPAQYLTYTTLTVEAEHLDDAPVSYRHYVYLTLWSTGDVTGAIPVVRSAMRTAGFGMDEERTDYEEDTKTFLVIWTWVGTEEA